VSEKVEKLRIKFRRSVNVALLVTIKIVLKIWYAPVVIWLKL